MAAVGVVLAELVNLCPHEIRLLLEHGEVVVEPTGLARCREEREPVGSLVTGAGDVPLVRCRYGEVVGLPDPAPGGLYIVSHLAAQHLPQRHDLLVPDHLVRNEVGVVIAAQALARL